MACIIVPYMIWHLGAKILIVVQKLSSIVKRIIYEILSLIIWQNHFFGNND
jgi:hypothetical protein